MYWSLEEKMKQHSTHIDHNSSTILVYNGHGSVTGCGQVKRSVVFKFLQMTFFCFCEKWRELQVQGTQDF